MRISPDYFLNLLLGCVSVFFCLIITVMPGKIFVAIPYYYFDWTCWVSTCFLGKIIFACACVYLWNVYEGEKKLWRKGQASRRSGEKEIRSSTLFACINSPIFENVLLRWLLRSSVNCSLSLSFSLWLCLCLSFSRSPLVYIRKRVPGEAWGQQPSYDPRSWIYFHPRPPPSPEEREREREKKIHRWREATYYFKRVRNTVCQRYPATRSFRRLFARLPPPVLPCPLRPMYYSNIWQ